MVAGGNKHNSKVFDVAKPEDAKLNTGSKPMVIGHKTLAGDPSIRETPIVEEKTVVDEQKSAPISKKTIVPPKTLDTSSSETTATQDEQPDTSTQAPPAVSEQDVAEHKKFDRPDSYDAVPPDHDDVVHELVKSKKYYLNIKQRSHFSFVQFLKTVLVLLLIIFVIGAGLLYSGVIGGDFQLPFTTRAEERGSLTPEEVTTPEEVETAAEKVTRQALGYSIEYPDSWTVVQSETSLDGVVLLTDTYTLASGTKLIVRQQPTTAAEDCQAQANDEPHAPGNSCPTLEFLSLQKVDLNEDDNRRLAEDTALYVTRARFTAINGDSSYLVCLSSYTRDNTPEISSPVVGSVSEECAPIVLSSASLNLQTTISGPDSTTQRYFNNPDILVIESVLRSFRPI